MIRFDGKKGEQIPGQSGRTKSFEEMSSMKSPDRKVSKECRIGSCRILADLRFEDVKSLGQWNFVKKGSDLKNFRFNMFQLMP